MAPWRRCPEPMASATVMRWPCRERGHASYASSASAPPTTRRLLLEILAETERHASELADYLKSTTEVRP